MDLFRRKWLFMIFGCGVCVFFCIQIFMVFNGLSAIKDSISSLKATVSSSLHENSEVFF
jgi:hypothetical protein